uniref:DNA helicase n=1 Tax=Tanacetum cinerariifolium TaxID=118510 RepID=A0A6L2J0C3_TANCI|nr:DNA helicase [Tanacetum cinerariifolium]
MNGIQDEIAAKTIPPKTDREILNEVLKSTNRAHTAGEQLEDLKRQHALEIEEKRKALESQQNVLKILWISSTFNKCVRNVVNNVPLKREKPFHLSSCPKVHVFTMGRLKPDVLYLKWVNAVKEKQEKDKIGSKPDNNGKRFVSKFLFSLSWLLSKLKLVCGFLAEIMSDIDCTNHDDDDQLCEQQRFNFMRLRNSNATADGHEGHDGSVPEDRFAFQESGDKRELPRVNVHTVSIEGNVSSRSSNETHDMLDTTTVPLSKFFDRFRNLGLRRELPRANVQTVSIGGNVSPRFSTETHDVLDTTTVPLSRVFDRFRNLGLNIFGSDYMCHAGDRVDERGCVRTNPLITASLEASFYLHVVCAEGVGSHVGSSSITAPVNHAYLCLNVTDCVIRPEIIPFQTTNKKMCMRVTHEERIQILLVVCPDTIKIVASSRLETETSDASSPTRHTSRRSSAHGRTPSYIDLGDCNQQYRHCGCLFWYNERLKNNNYGRRAEYHQYCGGGKIYMPPTPDPPLFIQQILRYSHFIEHIRAYNQMSDLSLDWITLSRRSSPPTVSTAVYLRHARGGEIPSFTIRFYNKGGARGYELPTSDVLGGIVFEDGPKSRTDFDVIIKFRGGPPHRINKLHQSYIPLQFPLLFVFGEPGFYPELVLKARDGSGNGKKVTMNAHYKYQLHPQVKGFGLIFRGGRLFQQYVVTAFCAVEQSHLSFIRKRQNDLRFDYLLGLYDAIDREGIQVGSMIMLPRTFTGGPRYMYNHYLDAVAIRLTPTDRADIVCRVFEQKSFKKRGLPHYHTLLWVDSSSKIQYASQIDKYIYVELPDPVEDPKGYKVVSKLMMHGTYGVANPSASCTEKGICNKRFPKMYNDKTFFDTNGPDRILGKIDRSIKDASTSTSERHIQILNVHLENMQRVNFREKDKLDVIVNMPDKKKTTVTEWYVYNNEHTDGRHLTYLDFPSEFVRYSYTKSWHQRVVRTKKSLGRLTYVHLNLSDLFYFRMLLSHQKGCKSPLEVRTINGQILPTYQAACEALGLLGDDREWGITLKESAVSASSTQLRILFAQILIYRDVSDPPKLWKKH